MFSQQNKGDEMKNFKIKNRRLLGIGSGG